MKTRTENIIKNSQAALLISIIQLVLNFVSRGVFLEHLGTDVLGLNSTAQTLLSFLNLAELGIGTAISVTLYKPLHNKDFGAICDIISLQGWLYRRIAALIIVAALILMCFFPIIFKDITLPLWYAFASFSVYLVGAILSYFFNYRQIILSANQEQYKLLFSTNVVTIFCIILQVIALKLFDNGYIWWLSIQFVSSFVLTFVLDRVIKRTHPYLKKSEKNGNELRKIYPEIVSKIKQVFVHRITTFIVFNLQPLIVYTYTSLTTVALYGNYMLIIQGLNVFSNAIFNGLNASVGNLIAAGDKQRINRVFEELYSSRFLMASTMVLATYFLTPHFITIWIGSEYIMPESTLILMLVTFFILVTRGAVDAYVNAYGIFQDVYAPIIEGIINLVASVAFGYLWGIDGVLIGGILSSCIVILGWKPYFLFKEGIKESLWIYIRIFAKHHLSLLAIIVAIYVFHVDMYWDIASNSYVNFALNVAIVCSVVCGVQLALLYPISVGMRDFCFRIINIIKK